MKYLNIFRNKPSQYGILGINGRNIECIYPNNPRKYFPKVDDKLFCKELLEEENIPVPITYGIVKDTRSLKQWKSCIQDIEEFVIKPNRSYGGKGILVIKKDGDIFRASDQMLNDDDITYHLKQIYNGAFAIDNISDKAYFEEMISNHSDFNKFLPENINGVCDIRLIYLYDEPVMSMLRLPTMESDGKANLHQGGIGVGIDIEKGTTLYGCYYNNIIHKHPETGFEFKGYHIPYFEQMIEYGSKISEIVGLGYIGVDFVCDNKRGPLVLEVNARPGLNIQIANSEGLRGKLH